MMRANSFLGFFLMTGCASLSPDECRVAQWQEVGFSDAAQGYLASRIGDHRSACASTDIRVDLAEYTLGYHLGLATYCQPATVYQLGDQNSAYPAQCDSQRFPLLPDAYSQGRQRYFLKEQRQTVQRERQDKLAQVRAVNAQIEEGRTRPTTKSAHGAHYMALKDLRNDLYVSIAKLEKTLERLDQLIQTQTVVSAQSK